MSVNDVLAIAEVEPAFDSKGAPYQIGQERLISFDDNEEQKSLQLWFTERGLSGANFKFYSQDGREQKSQISLSRPKQRHVAEPGTAPGLDD